MQPTGASVATRPDACRTERPLAIDWAARLHESRSGSQRKAVYAQYLNSAVWRGIRARIIERDGTCQDCGAAKQLQVHHLTYVRVGGLELDEDLVTLCGPCHTARHKLDCPKRSRRPKPTKRGPSKNAKKRAKGRAKKADRGYKTPPKPKRFAALDLEAVSHRRALPGNPQARALSIACPRCGSAPGQPCTNYGHPTQHAHIDRLGASRAIAQ